MSSKPITFKEIRSKAKGNPFLIIENGRFPSPWLSPDDLRAVLDNEPLIRAFIAKHRVTEPVAVTPYRVAKPAPVSVQPRVMPAPAPEPEPEPTPAPEPPAPVAQQQTDITGNVNPKVAALVARAMGGNTSTTTRRRFASVA